MARSQTTKTIAKRIDLSYFKSANALLRAKRVLIAIASCAAALYLAFNGWNRDQRLYNPGPVALAHANFEHNCFECHDSGGREGFIKTVSDSACLRCHDGPIHHGNQVRLVSAGADRAADCKSCHIEHRGRHALSTVSNDYCLQCHKDLSQNVKGGMTDVAGHVSVFRGSEHPRFGRELANSSGQWNDKTVVKFNHKLHMERPEIQANCVLCHTTSDVVPPGQPIKSNSQPPPYRTEKDRPAEWGKSGERRYVLPVTYEKHCAACHQITLAPLTTPSPTFAHQNMELVRAQIASLRWQYEQMLADRAQRKMLVARQKNEPAPADPAQRVRLTELPEAKGDEAWINRELTVLLDEEHLKDPTLAALGLEELNKALAASLSKLFEENRLKNPTLDAAGLEKLNEALAASPTVAANELSNRAELYLANSETNGCKKCHEVSGDVPAAWAAKRLAAKSSLDADKVELLKTQPTGMPAGPRRWFVHSRFDHDAHRNVGCVECHAQARESKLTSDVLMPNMESCVRCHFADTSKIKGATMDCMSCHVFHDRTRERMPTTRPR
jgi:hypothetical protein